jgi:hypothetical protein
VLVCLLIIIAMPPQENTALLPTSSSSFPDGTNDVLPKDKSSWWGKTVQFYHTTIAQRFKLVLAMIVIVVGCGIATWMVQNNNSSTASSKHQLQEEWTKATGPYKIVDVHEGKTFFDGFHFYQGADSLGSAGYLTYKNAHDAKQLNLVNVTTEDNVVDPFATSSTTTTTSRDFVYMSSQPTPKGPRDSVRLEGKQRYNRGLFILDLRHLPTGCGYVECLTKESIHCGGMDSAHLLNTYTHTM